MAESLQNIKRRVKGVKNINQITKAMELVAATKMRKSQEIALASRPYAFAALHLLANLARIEGAAEHTPLLAPREVKKRAYVLVTSDKGLAGAFNSNVIRQFQKFTAAEGIDFANENNSFIAIGQKAAAYLERETQHLAGQFVRVGDYTSPAEAKPIAKLLIDGYMNGNWDEVIIFSTHFRTALRQDVLERRILPVTLEAIRATAREIIPEHGRFANLTKEESNGRAAEYIIEPSAEAILHDLTEHLVMMEVYHLILEANASEHAARRVAMKNASDNAEELADKLNLQYNKSRQAAITREIIEITAGAESLQ